MPTRRELDRLARSGVDQALIDALAQGEDHPKYKFRHETRCRVCRAGAADAVNRLLANGHTYADTLRIMDVANQMLPDDQKMTYDSIYNHAKKHFPVQDAAKAVYRKVLERRAEEDFVTGIGNILTPIAFYEVVMQKSFSHLIEANTIPDIDQGMKAAQKVAEFQAAADASGIDLAEAMGELQKITEAVKAVVPREMWGRILAHMDGQRVTQVVEEDED